MRNLPDAALHTVKAAFRSPADVPGRHQIILGHRCVLASAQTLAIDKRQRARHCYKWVSLPGSRAVCSVMYLSTSRLMAPDLRPFFSAWSTCASSFLFPIDLAKAR